MKQKMTLGALLKRSELKDTETKSGLGIRLCYALAACDPYLGSNEMDPYTHRYVTNCCF